MDVLVDPGHGGDDRGAVVKETEEAPINLDVGLRLRDMINRLHLATAYTTRTEDTGLTLRSRGSICNVVGAQFVLHIHCDSRPMDPSATGLVAYYWPKNEVAHEAAKTIMKAAPSVLRAGRAQPIAA